MTTSALSIKHTNTLGPTWSGNDFLIRDVNIFGEGGSHEIDLRKEMRTLLCGDGVTTGKGFTVIQRQVIKDQRGRAWNRGGASYDEAVDNDPLVSRAVWPVRDVLRTCMKHKFIGTEFQTPVGQLDYESVKLYFEWNISIDKDDQIIEIATDDLGKPILPIKYIKRHSIKDVEIYHGLNGRVEYQRVIAIKAE